MKSLLVLFSLVSYSAFASTPTLLLDASCKINCNVGKVEEEVDQVGTVSHDEFRTTYVDIVGMTRSQIENKMNSELTQICRQAFSSQAIGVKSDCLYFKH